MRRASAEDAELAMDALLGIRTTGRDESHADQDNNPYEPTPYPVLERLANSGLVGKRNLLVDYGCGKGRVGFYLSHQARCRTLGVERDRWLYECALRNRDSAHVAAKTAFTLADAAQFAIPPEADRFYLFNPFSAAVFEQVLGQLRTSLAAHPRKALLFLYYPDDSYLAPLERVGWLGSCDPIDCRDLFGGEDPRETIVVYRTRP